MNSPLIYHGEWWIPAKLDPSLQMLLFEPESMMGKENRYTGTLTYYEDKGTTLELYHIPSNFRGRYHGSNPVIWGKDANGNFFTLFNVDLKNHFLGDFTKTEFTVGLILIGIHVLSLDDTSFNQCIVKFPYLRNWAFHSNLTCQLGEKYNYYISLSDSIFSDFLVNADVESGVKWLLRDKWKMRESSYDLSINQYTEFLIESSDGISIRSYLKHITEFSQFLSIALYCEQNPIEVRFKAFKSQQESFLLFEKDVSIDPKVSSLIKFKLLKDKVPAILRSWHENFDKVAPISRYLLDSLRNNKTFDVPDFLIIAQALDGFHKRFVNKREGKDIRKYEDQIGFLLEQFKDVDVVRKCNINPVVLKDSRHKYSHLYPDEEKSSAVEGEKLYWLTEKCKILLTCCILNMMGLSNEEINICCNNSPIQNIIKTLSFEMEI